MSEFKINNYEDRKNVIIAFVNAGYKVSVKEVEVEKRVLYPVHDYYIVIE